MTGMHTSFINKNRFHRLCRINNKGADLREHLLAIFCLSFSRAVRKNNDPFGGIQLILCGDFLQLPPVAKGKEKRRFCFEVGQCIMNSIESSRI